MKSLNSAQKISRTRMSVVVNRNAAAREISLELKNAQFNNEQGASLLNDAIRGGRGTAGIKPSHE